MREAYIPDWVNDAVTERYLNRTEDRELLEDPTCISCGRDLEEHNFNQCDKCLGL